MSKYKAKMSNPLAAMTWTICMLFLVASAICAVYGLWLIAVPLLGILVCMALFSISGYSIRANAILIHRLLWATRLEIAGIKDVYADTRAMDNSVRTGGADGLFATVGYYTNKTLGDYRAFVTDPGKAVVIKKTFETIVLSPSDPESFANELRQHCTNA